MGTIRDTIAEGTKGASNLSPKDKDRYNADIRATNILIQGLPKDIYTLINHYTEAKYIWDNVKMLLEGSELMKEDRESQLYDDFEHFRQNKGETIHDYYVQFSKLINVMRNIKMTMSRMQLNSKFEQVELYERRAKFKLTEREQKIEEQLRIVITDRNIKEENLKKEIHYVKMQLTSTINHNKSMVEEVTSLKKDFKQKENKYLEEFLDMKALKEKPALYNGHEIIKTNHVPAIVHNSEDTLEIANITRKEMSDKMKDPDCVKKKFKIAPHDYSKENYLATFTPQKQLTPEQIFWSKDLIKMKVEALKEQITSSRPIKALTVYLLNTHATLVPRVLPTKI
ncbi:hypothetical protein Tco_0636021 [Tanacetum coccineum]